ncbi:MAG: AI-2E family transporter [Thermoleophilia bacterium]
MAGVILDPDGPGRSQPEPEAPIGNGPPQGFRPRTVLAVLGIVLGALLLLALGYLAWRAITWVLVAAFLAVALDPLVRRLEQRGLGRSVAVATVFALALALLGVFGFLVIPPLVREVTTFVDRLPELIRELDRGQGPLGFLERRTHVVDRIQKAFDEGGAASALGLTTPLVSVVRDVIGVIFAVIAIAFLTLFMLIDGRRWVAGFLDAVPPRSRPRWERVLAGISRTIGGYVTGNLVISVIAGLVAGGVLAGLGVPYAVPLAVLAAILDLIPLVGATLATVVLALAALTQGVWPAVIVVVALLVYQQIENHLLQPYVYGRAVQLSGLAVLVSVLIGGELAGVLGALAAIPVGGSISVVAGELLRWRRETRIELPPGVLDEIVAAPTPAETGEQPAEVLVTDPGEMLDERARHAGLTGDEER